MPGSRDWLVRLRLWSGLLLFVYATSHLINHALGVVSLNAMEAGREVFTAVWRNPLGSLLLYGGILVHTATVIVTLYRRRSWRGVSGVEVLQILSALALPPLLMVHVLATRGLHQNFGIDDSYAYVVMSIWVWDPAQGARQAVALLLAWLHGCVGLHYWLRLKPAYRGWQPYALAGAVLVPVLALFGVVSAGREVTVLAQDPAWMAAFRSAVNLPGQHAVDWVYDNYDQSLVGMAATLGLFLAVLLVRFLLGLRRATITVTYPGDATITVPRGTSVLEASRRAPFPHAAVCGGRGRCSTCRIRINSSAADLPPAGEDELKVLRRVGAPEGVRLACQLRPMGNLSVVPLLPAGATAHAAHSRPAYLQGSEQEVAILFGDLRAFTRFAEAKLPYDVVFVVNQYARAMGRAIERAGGRVDKFIGDGVMALFGIDGGPEQGARQALEAARAMSAALAELNAELAEELDQPFRIGIGIDIGAVIVGEMGYAQATTVTAIGDAVNTASRLEGLTKEFGVQLVVSRRVARRADVALDDFPSRELEVRGRSRPMTAFLIDDAEQLAPVLNSE